MNQLPPLNALRTFEAAARRLSFTEAARELNVTQAAVSHQIRSLEDWFGFPLFLRAGRRLSLTEKGEYLLPAVSGAMSQLTTAVDQLLDPERDTRLTVSMMYSFAATWLVPRLRRFRQEQPEIDVRITNDDRLVDFRTEDVDMAIRYGRGGWRDVVALRLMEEDIFPVCSPALLAENPLETPDDLANHTLIHDEHEFDWGLWLKAAKVTGVNPRRGPFYQTTALALQTAVDGQGVALGRGALVADHIESGELVRPFDLALPDDYAFYVVFPPSAASTPRVQLFCDWLFREAGRVRPDLPTGAGAASLPNAR